MNPRTQVERLSTETAKSVVSDVGVRALLAGVSLGTARVLHVYVDNDVAAIVVAGTVFVGGVATRFVIRVRARHRATPVKFVNTTRF